MLKIRVPRPTFGSRPTIWEHLLYRLRFKAKKAIEKIEIHSTLKNRDLIL